MDRPVAVENAIRLLLASICLTVLLAIWVAIFPRPLPPGLPVIPGVTETIRAITPIIAAATALFMGFVAYKISQGRNWAKRLFVVTFAIGLIGTVPSLYGMWKYDRLGSISGLVQTLIQTGAVWYLYTKDARRWFEERKYDR